MSSEFFFLSLVSLLKSVTKTRSNGGTSRNRLVNGYDKSRDVVYLPYFSTSVFYEEKGMNRPGELIKLMRPLQWWKNGFVFIGLFFGHAWADETLLIRVIAATLAFSFASSAMYIFNDWSDCASDRHHPKKKERPLAAGTVSVPMALALGIILWVAALSLAWLVSITDFWLILGYTVLNLAYSYKLKDVVLVDAFVISAGFILRVLAGTIGVGIHPSEWLLLCTTMLTLFLGFSKRRAEILVLGDQTTHRRKVLAQYTPELLDNLLSVTSAGAIISYSLYTTAPQTIQVHHTQYLIATVPMVTYGIFRYLYLLHRWKAGENPARELLGDRHIIVTGLIWAATTIWLIS